MKVAALDLGSNTFLCLIADVTSDGIQNIHSDEVQVVRLGQGLNEAKKFHPEALKRADTCLEAFAKTIKKHQPEKVLAMATSAARDAENREELFALAKKHGIPLEIIPGEKEAEITYQGAVSGSDVNDKNLLVIDIGGGSTEFIFGRGRQRGIGASYDIGCVRLTERFIRQQPTADADVQAATQHIEQSILKARNLASTDFKLDTILAVAGTPTSLAAAEIGQFDAQRIDGYRMTRKSLESWLQKLQQATVEQKIGMGIPAGRADVILIGVITLLSTLKIFEKDELSVSTRGVRYGVALEMAERYLS